MSCFPRAVHHLVRSLRQGRLLLPTSRLLLRPWRRFRHLARGAVWCRGAGESCLEGEVAQYQAAEVEEAAEAKAKAAEAGEAAEAAEEVGAEVEEAQAEEAAAAEGVAAAAAAAEAAAAEGVAAAAAAEEVAAQAAEAAAEGAGRLRPSTNRRRGTRKQA
jgi:hypothetical protein